MAGWIGVDLDGTLAEYHGWNGIEHIGDPIPPMFARVKSWLNDGKTVKIFTARVSGRDGMEKDLARYHIWKWCEKHGLPLLEVTNVKDFGMLELWDDRAVQVEMNTGRRIGRKADA
jgi:hypothetical protein